MTQQPDQPDAGPSDPATDRRSRHWLDSLLVAGTMVPTWLYWPMVQHISFEPRPGVRGLILQDAFWMFPMLLWVLCLGAALSWLLRGATVVGRMIWLGLLVGTIATLPWFAVAAILTGLR